MLDLFGKLLIYKIFSTRVGERFEAVENRARAGAPCLARAFQQSYPQALARRVKALANPKLSGEADVSL
jgi:hypothetical protein